MEEFFSISLSDEPAGALNDNKRSKRLIVENQLPGSTPYSQ
jgi:hypothetical protein